MPTISANELTSKQGSVVTDTKQTAGTTITLTVSVEDKKRFKIHAINNNITMSELFHQWVEQNCGRI